MEFTKENTLNLMEEVKDHKIDIRNTIEKYHNTIPVDVLIIAYNQQIKTIYSNIFYIIH